MEQQKGRSGFIRNRLIVAKDKVHLTALKVVRRKAVLHECPSLDEAATRISRLDLSAQDIRVTKVAVRGEILHLVLRLGKPNKKGVRLEFNGTLKELYDRI